MRGDRIEPFPDDKENAMDRRDFLVGSAGLALLMGCQEQPQPAVVSSSRPPRERSESELASFVRDRIQSRLAIQTTFDPITILALVGFVMRIFQACQEAAILRQQAACRAKPNGATARRLKARLHDRFANQHHELSDAAIASHVDAAMEAFVDAGDAEIRSLKRDLDRLNRQPTEIDLKLFTDNLSES